MATLNVKQFPDGLYRQLRQMAKQQGRSISQQVVCLLRQSSEGAQQSSILQLRGLGKEVWRKTDSKNFVRKKRDSWE